MSSISFRKKNPPAGAKPPVPEKKVGRIEEKFDEPPPPPPDEDEKEMKQPGRGPIRNEFKSTAVNKTAVNNAQQLVSDLSGAKGKTENELLQAAMRLQEISSNKHAAKRMNKNREAVKTLILAIKEKPRFGKLVEYSVDCLTNLCVDDDTCLDLIEEGVLDVLKDIMKINPFNEKLQRAVGRCIEKMTATPAFSEQIANQGALDLMVNSLNKHHEDLTHEQNSVTLMKMFKDSPSNVAKFVEKGGLQAVVKVMQDNPDNAKIMSSMGVIVAELSKNPQYALQFHRLGVLDSQIEAIVNFPEHGGVVKSAIQYFNNLIKADRRHLEEIRTKGGIDAAILAMEMNPDDEGLLDLGAQLMNNMSGEAELAHAVKAVGGANFTSAAAVAKIGNLALVGDNVDFIMANGGVQALITAIRIACETPEVEESKKIIESALRAFGRLCTNPKHVQAIIDQGGLDCVMGILKDFQHVAEYHAEGITSLARITDNKVHGEAVVVRGGMKVAKAALDSFGDNARVVNAAIDYLTQNAKVHPQGVGQFVKEGGIPVLFGVLEQYLDDTEMLLKILNAVMGMLESSPEALQQFVSAGGLEKMVDILNGHLEDPKVVLAALTIFDKLATDEKLAQRMGETDAISDTIFAAIDKHAGDADIQAIGGELVGKLSSKDEFGTMVMKVNEWLQQLLRGNPEQQQVIGQKIIKSLQKVADLAQIPEQAKLLAEKGAVQATIAAFKTALQMKPSEVRSGIIAAAASATVRFLAEDLVDPSQVTYEMFKAILDHALASPDNENLALKAALLAQELAQEGQTAVAMVQDGAIQKLLTLSSYFPLNDSILASVVVAIGRLAAADPKAIQQILKAGGHELVVMSAYTNMDNVDNLLNAMSVLATLQIDDDATDMIVKAGAVEVLIKALKLYPGNVDVQIMAIEMLAGMAITEDVIKQITEAGLLPLIIKAMGEFRETEELQKAILNLLSKLATNHDFVLQMLANDMSNVVLAIADANPDCAAIQDLAANLLTIFAENLEDQVVDEDQFDDLKIEEGIENIKSATADIANMEQEQTINVIDQLKSLSSSKGAVWKLAQEGGFGTLMDILMNNLNDPSVVLACIDALDEMLEAMGEEVGHIENIEEVIGSITQTMVALDKMADVDPDKVKAMLKHLYNLSKVKENRKALIKKGILDPLMKMFDQYPEDAEVLSDVAKLLGLYAAEEEMWKRFLRDNTIAALIRAMKKFINVEKFEQYGEYLLGTLALYEPLKLEIVRCNGIEVTAEIMERWDKSVAVISNCNYCLANCSFNNDDVVSRIVGCSALQSIVTSMENHSEAPELLESAATTLSNLCYGSDGNKELIARLGAAKGLVDVVLRNYSRPNLLIAAFRAIGNLAYYLDNVPIIIQEGAVQGIVAGMTVHVDDLEVIKIALGVMTNLAADAKEENQAIMAQEGAVQAICEVANAHADKEEVEMAAISCLVNLVQEEYNGAMVVRQGGVLGVVKAMQTLSHDTELMQTAMRLIYEVSKNEKMAGKIIKTPNGIETICQLMDKYPTDPSISSDGLRAFFHLASNKETAEKLGRKGALPITMKIVETRMRDLPQLKEALRALGSLARSENMANQMALDSMALVLKALQLYYKDNVFCELTLGFIGNVCCFDSSADKVGSTDIIPIIISTTKAKQEHKVVVLRGLRALENLAYSSDVNKAKLKKEGSLLAIDTIKKFWMKDEEVEQACTAAMDAILSRRKRDQNTDVFSNIRARLKDQAKFDGKELPQAMKNMLIAGTLMTKHSDNALPHPKHVFISRDLKKLCWRDPKKPNEEAKFLKMSAIKVINKGRCTPQLRRRNAFGKHYAKEERSFACLTKDRNVSLECGTEQERDEWVDALNALKLYQKMQKQGTAKPE